MRFLSFILLLSLSFSFAQSQSTYQAGDTLYVWASSGLNIRSQPSIQGTKKGGLPLGTKVVIQEITDQTFETREVQATEDGESSFYIKGHWVKVTNGQIEGYAVDSYLLPFPTPQGKSTLEAYLEGLAGKALTFKEEKNENCEEEEEGCYTRIGPMIQGLQLTYGFDGNYRSESLFMKGMRIQQAYVFSAFFYFVENTLSELLKRAEMGMDVYERNYLEFNEVYEIMVDYRQEEEGVKWTISFDTYGAYYETYRPDLYLTGSEYRTASEIDPRKFLDLSFSSEKAYKAAQFPSRPFLQARRDLVTYADSMTAFYIPLRNGDTLKRIDNDCTCESIADFNYTGYIEALDAVGIFSTYWEDYSYDLFSLQDGQPLFYGMGDIAISYDTSWMVSMAYDVYDEGTDFSMTRIDKDGKLVDRLGFYFSGWGIDGDLHWQDERSFIIPVVYGARDEEGERKKMYIEVALK
ncbi:MAG: SH3 domain-containing protein [Bacteroidota bacterium]